MFCKLVEAVFVRDCPGRGINARRASEKLIKGVLGFAVDLTTAADILGAFAIASAGSKFGFLALARLFAQLHLHFAKMASPTETTPTPHLDLVRHLVFTIIANQKFTFLAVWKKLVGSFLTTTGGARGTVRLDRDVVVRWGLVVVGGLVVLDGGGLVVLVGGRLVVLDGGGLIVLVGGGLVVVGAFALRLKRKYL